jgi:ribose 5-phosphate isomerase B
MRVALAADHGGAGLKAELLERLPGLGLGSAYEFIDLGGDGSDASDDYPDFSRALGRAIQERRVDRGILVCGSGVGAAIAASKMRGVRASVCHDTYSARQGVEHDDMNVLCLGARIIAIELALECARAFLGARFSGEARHVRRLAKVNAIEDEAAGPSPTGRPREGVTSAT